MAALFASHPVGEHLDAVKAAMLEEIREWDPDALLQLAEQDFVDYLVGKHHEACPTLRRENAVQEPVRRVRMEKRNRAALEFQPWTVDAPEIVLVVPYDGAGGLFHLRPSSHTTRRPHGDVHTHDLRITWRSQHSEPAGVQGFFDDQLNLIERYLEWLRDEIGTFNRDLPGLARRIVAARRRELLADRDLQAALTFPIRHRDDAAAYDIPIRRKKLTIQRPTAAPGGFQPEPQISEDNYEAALAVLRNARNALERSPSLTAHLNEPQIRDLLLVFLNAQFEGQASGEVFNGHGKTDILIRVGDRNLFIAECKIWKSPATIRQGLDQLGRYLVWRDTKAALLLFIRGGDVTSKVGKALAEVEKHPNRKRMLPSSEPDERHDFVFRANDDQAREIRLAFMPFALG